MFSQSQGHFSHLIKKTLPKHRHQANNPPLEYQQQALQEDPSRLYPGYRPLNKYFHAQFRLRPNARTLVPDKEVFDDTFRPKYIISLKNNFTDLELTCHSICGDVEKETRFLNDRMRKRGLMKDWCAVYEFIDDNPEPKLGEPPVSVVGPKTQRKADDRKEEGKKRERKAGERVKGSGVKKDE